MTRTALSMLTTGALAATLLVAGCSDSRQEEAERRAREAKEQAAAATETAAEQTREAAGRAADVTRDAMTAAQQAIENAGDSEAAKKAAEAGAAATAVAADLTRAAASAAAGGALTAAVKTALIADRDIEAAGIDVDTSEAAKTVTLSGRVPTAAQRTAAVALARTKAPGYEIVDRLTVGPRP